MSKGQLLNIPNCLKFTGYKPCVPYKICEECSDPVPAKEYILIISLEAQGAVLMSTSLLDAIRQKYPDSYLIWLTRQEAVPLLENNHLINKVLSWNDENRMLLRQLKFDIVFSLDKSQYAGAFVNSLNAGEKYGFGLSPHGFIIPLNEGALYNFRLGLNDSLKFHDNKRTGVDILHETVELPYSGEKYNLYLSKDEIEYKNKWGRDAGLSKDDIVIGFNTGCSKLFPNKKLTIEQHVTLINLIYDYDPQAKIILLGGSEDTERNIEIQKLSGKRVINTPTTEGLRRGIIYTDLADIVVSGDSLGMHLAVGLGKYVMAWFGLSCTQEIDLFGRGEKIQSGVYCEPCWKKACDDLKCLRELSLDRICVAVTSGIKVIKAEKAGQTLHASSKELKN